jgi:hypothetical protein
MTRGKLVDKKHGDNKKSVFVTNDQREDIATASTVNNSSNTSIPRLDNQPYAFSNDLITKLE